MDKTPGGVKEIRVWVLIQDSGGSARSQLQYRVWGGG